MTGRWRIELFGGLRARRGDRVVTRFRSQKTAVLLAYLARHPGQLHAREVLVELLWPGSRPDAGRSSLGTALWALRRQLEPDDTPRGTVVLADRSAVGLDQDAITTDVAEFERAVASVRGIAKTERPTTLARVVDLYTGEFMAGYYEGWLLAEQRRLGDLFHQALATLTRDLEQKGELAQGIDYAWRGVELDPLREEAHRDLIRLQIAAGRPELALQQYRELERALMRELGAAPSKHTRVLIDGIEAEGRDAASVRVGVARTRTTRVRIKATLPTQGTFVFLLIERASRASDEGLGREVRKHGGLGLASEGPFTAAFASAQSALACVISAHQGLAHKPAPGDEPVPAMALDAGSVEIKEGRYSGEVLLQAASLLQTAHPGQVLCSERAAGLLLVDRDPRLHLLDLGLFRLGPSEIPQRLHQLEYAGMEPRDFPAPSAAPACRGSLPTPLTSFFGREDELDRLRDLLASREARLVTLAGPSGVGKTRLALEIAREAMGHFEGAVWFAALAEMTDADLVYETILRALRVDVDSDVDRLRQIEDILSSQQSLLVLDNFEQLLPAGADCVRELLERVPELTCVATSRRRLGIPGEHHFPLSPLAAPRGDESLEEILRSSSVRLFEDRAQTVSPDFQVTESNAAAVAELCAGLEGIPLALELAAGKAHALTPERMLERLTQRFDLLVTRDSSRPAHHRSLRAAVECSWELLSTETQRFFARLSVFHGGWTLEAAEAVGDEPLAADYLAELCEASLVTSDAGPAEMRFHMMETLREFAAEQLAAEDRSTHQARHTSYYAALAEEADPHLSGPEDMQWLGRLDADFGNLRATLVWALEAQPQLALRLALDLVHYCEIRGRWREGCEALEQALQRAPGAPLRTRAKAMCQIGWLSHLLGDDGSARDMMARGLELSKRIGDDEYTQMGLYALAHIATGWDRLDERRRLFGESLEIARRRGDQNGVARALQGLGYTAASKQDYPAARGFYEESLAITRQVGSTRAVANMLAALGELEDALGSFLAAQQLYEEAREMHIEVGDRFSIAGDTTALGHVSRRRGDLEDARAKFEESLAAMRELGSRRNVAEALRGLGLVHLAGGHHEEARRSLEESLRIVRGSGHVGVTAAVLECLAKVAAAEGVSAEAVRLFAAAAALRGSVRQPKSPSDREEDEALFADLRNTMGDEGYDDAWQAGWGSASQYR